MHWPLSRFGDPGPCPVDDAPHTTCTSPDVGPAIVVVQLPMRDEQLAATRPPMAVPDRRAPTVTLQPGEFTTKTYRGQAKRRS